MLESFFLTVNEWIAGGTVIAAVGCFVWGMVSVVFSPCHLASIPLIVAYVGGQQMDNSAWQGAGNWFRKGAGAVIGLLGIYFISSPFIDAV